MRLFTFRGKEQSHNYYAQISADENSYDKTDPEHTVSPQQR